MTSTAFATSTDAAIQSTDKLIEVEFHADVWEAILSLMCAEMNSRHFSVDGDALTMAEIGANILAKYIPLQDQIRLRNYRSQRGAIVFINSLPRSALRIPPTPTSGFGNDAELQVYDALLLGLQHICGLVPASFAYENNWKLMRNVVFNPTSKGKRSSHGSDETGHHTDNPCGKFESWLSPWMPPCTPSSPIPRTLAFICLRNRDRFGNPVSTDVLPLDSIREHLDEEAFSCLQKPEFQVNPPASNSCQPLRGVPLIELVDGSHCLRFNANPAQVFGLTEQARWALEEFKNAIVLAEPKSLKFELNPLSILLFDNYAVAHNRRSFDPGDDLDNSRWLRRCYGMSSICCGWHVDRGSWPYVLR